MTAVNMNVCCTAEGLDIAANMQHTYRKNEGTKDRTMRQTTEDTIWRGYNVDKLSEDEAR